MVCWKCASPGLCKARRTRRRSRSHRRTAPARRHMTVRRTMGPQIWKLGAPWRSPPMAEAWRPWKDWATVVIGVLLFITPFVLGSTGSATAAGTAYVGGVLLVIAGVWTLSTRSVQFSEWAEVLIGVLLFVAPWVLGFSGLTSMALSAWIAGV